MDDRARYRIRQLPPDERSRLVNAFIEPHRHKVGRTEFILRETGVPVWSIIGYLPAVSCDIEQAARDHEVSRDALIAAISYYLDYEAVIDERLLQNRAADEQ